MAKRVDHAFGRVGAYSSNGSGDYAIIFSTHRANRVTGGTGQFGGSNEIEVSRKDIRNRNMSALFMATVEATEEAIINSLFMAETVSSRYGTMEALPVDKTCKSSKIKALNWNKNYIHGKICINLLTMIT